MKSHGVVDLEYPYFDGAMEQRRAEPLRGPASPLEPNFLSSALATSEPGRFPSPFLHPILLGNTFHFEFYFDVQAGMGITT